MQVFDKAGKPQLIGDELARGGEGAVHVLSAKPTVVVKIYHPDLLNRRGNLLREKVDAMVGLRQHFNTSFLAWPALSVYDEHGTCLAMRCDAQRVCRSNPTNLPSPSMNSNSTLPKVRFFGMPLGLKRHLAAPAAIADLQHEGVDVDLDDS